MYARAGAGPPLIVTLSKNVGRVVGIASCWGSPTRPIAPPGRTMPSAVSTDCVVADALEHGVGAEAVGQFAHALDRLLAALADDVRCAELLGERDPVGMTAEEDDPLGAEPLRGDHAAEADGAVADDGRRLCPARPARRGRRGGRCPSRRRA